MSIKNKVVIHNPTTKKHEPLASGDVLAGSIIQVSTDAGNSLQLGTDGGLKVAAVAQLPDDQVLTGDTTGSVSLTLTPDTQPNGDVNYTVKGDVKIDPAAGNAAVATSSGLYVPSKQVEYGTSLGILKNTIITFANPFPSVPFISVTHFGNASKLSDCTVDSITTTGFVIRRGYRVADGGRVDVQWKAEEK